MNKADTYLYNLLTDIKNNGTLDENPRPKYEDGTPAHTLSVNGQFRKYNIGAGEFPISTLRPIAIKSAIKEIFWIYQKQSSHLDILHDTYGVKYWDQWESKDMPGTIGMRYGATVRHYDQMNRLLNELVSDPFGRRHIIDLYQYQDLNETDGLIPCAFCTIWNVRKVNEDYYLDVTLIQRSGDSIAASCSGVNECQYAALLMMVARHCGYKVGWLYHMVANEQIYDRHMQQAEELMRRYEALREQPEKPEPMLILKESNKSFYEFTIDDFEIVNYNPIQPQLKFELGI